MILSRPVGIHDRRYDVVRHILVVCPQLLEVVVYEPSLRESDFFRSRVIRDLDAFKEMSDVIIANRLTEELADVEEKIYTRDIYGRD